MTTISVDVLTDQVGRYLQDLEPGERAAAVSFGQRSVYARSRTWRPWLAGTASARGESQGPMPGAAAAAALRALADLPPAPTGTVAGDVAVTRSHLVALSTGAVDDDARVRAWVATMIWGSGTSNGRGPWRTSQGLRSDVLMPALATSQAQVRAGDVAGAYRAFAVPGCGEAFATKWLWVAALDGHADVVPLVLDSRVLATLARAHRPLTGTWARPRGAGGYAQFVEAMHDAATQLSSPDLPLTGEHLEWLTFRRGTGCLHEWLGKRAGAVPGTDGTAR